MGKDKVTEEILNTTNNTTNLIFKYAPIFLAFICLIICYFLFKKIQTIHTSQESNTKLEKEFITFVKEQSEVNAVNNKKFNSIMSQINQIGYLIQNSNINEMKPDNGKDIYHNMGQTEKQHNMEQNRNNIVVDRIRQSEKQNNMVLDQMRPVNTSNKVDKENTFDDMLRNKIQDKNEDQVVEQNVEQNVDITVDTLKPKEKKTKKKVIIEEESSDED